MPMGVDKVLGWVESHGELFQAISSIGTLFAVYLAYRGLSVWRKEYLEKDKFDKFREMQSAAAEILFLVESCRNTCYIYSHEIYGKEPLQNPEWKDIEGLTRLQSSYFQYKKRVTKEDNPELRKMQEAQSQLELIFDYGKPDFPHYVTFILHVVSFATFDLDGKFRRINKKIREEGGEGIIDSGSIFIEAEKRKRVIDHLDDGFVRPALEARYGTFEGSRNKFDYFLSDVKSVLKLEDYFLGHTWCWHPVKFLKLKFLKLKIESFYMLDRKDGVIVHMSNKGASFSWGDSDAKDPEEMLNTLVLNSYDWLFVLRYCMDNKILIKCARAFLAKRFNL